VFRRAKKDRQSDGQHAAEKPAVAPVRPAPALTQPVERGRTTSYPQGTEGAPPKRGQLRVTSYPTPSQVNSRGYDSIN